MDTLGTFIFPILLGIPFAVGNYYLARRLGKNSTKYVILSLIPVFNYCFFFYLTYLVVFKILDKLDSIDKSNHHGWKKLGLSFK